MQNLKVWVKRISVLIKSERKRKGFRGESTLIRVDNVSWEQRSIIDLNHYQIFCVNTVGVLDRCNLKVF
jgi:hypothetical protein